MSESPFLAALMIWSSIATSNYVWQWFSADPDYVIAFGRSYWQGVAVFAFAVALKVSP